MEQSPVRRDAVLTHLSSNPPHLREITTTSKTPDLPIDVLVLTVDDDAFAACYNELKHPFRCYYQELGYVYFNSVERQRGILKVALLICYADSVDSFGTLIAVKNATPLLRPKGIIYVGTCTGLNSEKMKLGDVVVSIKLTTNDASTPVSPKFRKLILTCAHGWKAPLEKPEYSEAIKVHSGEFLSGPTLDRAGHPITTAVCKGADGVYAASFENKVEWLIVGGISAYANGSQLNEESWKRFASMMAASLVTHILSDPKVFDHWPNYSGCRSSTPAKKRMASPQATHRTEAIAKNYAAAFTEVNLSTRREKQPLAAASSTEVNISRRGEKQPLAAPAYTKVNLSRRGQKRPLAGFSEMPQQNKVERRMSMDIGSGSQPKKGKTSRDPNTPSFRKTIKIQLKRPKYMRTGSKRTFVDVDEQKQIRFDKLATLENVVKACAFEFLGIQEESYEEEIARRNIDVFLLDGRARVTDPTFPYNKTSFNFTYLKPSDLSYGNISETSAQSIQGASSKREGLCLANESPKKDSSVL